MSLDETARGLGPPDLVLAAAVTVPPDDGGFTKQPAHYRPPSDPDTKQTDLGEDEKDLDLNEKDLDLNEKDFDLDEKVLGLDEKDLVLLAIGESRDQKAPFKKAEVRCKDETDLFVLSAVLDQEQTFLGR